MIKIELQEKLIKNFRKCLDLYENINVIMYIKLLMRIVTGVPHQRINAVYWRIK